MVRTDKYEAKKPSFFRDRILANKHLWLLYKEGKILKSDVAKVLGTSEGIVMDGCNLLLSVPQPIVKINDSIIRCLIIPPPDIPVNV